MDRPYAKVIVNEKAERSLRQGHPWVYGAEVIEREGEAQNGDMVDVYSKKRRWLGAGFLNDRSKILVRLISQNANDSFDAAFFRRRLRHAVDFRAAVMGDDFDACRLIFGEADFFPGWTVDRYGDILVSEVLSLGVDCRRELLYSLLLEVLAERGVKICAVYERNEAALRDKEGLPKYKGFLDLPGLACDLDGHVEICENGIYYDVDYINGQKTGFFLDQKYNRRAAARLAPGRRVLDCCTHTGAFALNAAKACAASVTAVDVSADALALARRNAAMNGLEDKIDFLCADVFDLLTRLVEEKSHDFDYVILDPPAFTKAGLRSQRPIAATRRSTSRPCACCPGAAFLPPAPAPIS